MVGRPGRGLVLLKVWVLPETLEVLEAGRGDGTRSEYARELLEAGLGGVEVVKPVRQPVRSEIEVKLDRVVAAKSVVPAKPVAKLSVDRWGADKAVLIAALRERRMSTREAVAALGWNAMRVEAVARQLGGQVAIRAGGVMELVDE
jgi:hypothetical protein